MRTQIKTVVNKFAILNHTALILGVHALRSYLKLICEYELRSLPNKTVSGANDHGKNYIKVRPPLVRHLLRNRLCLSPLQRYGDQAIFRRLKKHVRKHVLAILTTDMEARLKKLLTILEPIYCFEEIPIVLFIVFLTAESISVPCKTVSLMKD